MMTLGSRTKEEVSWRSYARDFASFAASFKLIDFESFLAASVYIGVQWTSSALGPYIM